MTRRAHVKNAMNADHLNAYIEGTDYRIVGGHKDSSGKTVFVIEGEDVAGWTLDDYVIPRLASGLIFAEEVDLS